MFLHYKRRYQTCLQMLDEVRREFEVLRHEKMSYAGVLDPMAEGWVPILVGKAENQNRLQHTQSAKEYKVGILLGIQTDSNDLMGIVERFENKNLRKAEILFEVVRRLEEFPSSYNQKVSAFANKKYRSKPLWWYKLNEVDLPEEALVERSVQILDGEIVSMQEITREYLVEEIVAMSEVFGESFRMPRVVPSWGKFFEEVIMESFVVLEVRMVVSKGFFVREFVRDMSIETGVPMCVHTLKRTKVFEQEYQQ